MKGGHRHQWKSRDTSESQNLLGAMIPYDMPITAQAPEPVGSGGFTARSWFCQLCGPGNCPSTLPVLWCHHPYHGDKGSILLKRLNETMDDLDAIREGSVETEHQPLQNEATQSEMQT